MNPNKNIQRLLFIILIFSFQSYSLSQERKLSFITRLNYTTDAKVFLFPNASDFVIRNTPFPIEGILNFSLEGRYSLSKSIQTALNFEYIEATKTGANLVVFDNSRAVLMNVEDGFFLVPVELSLHYILPFSSDDVKFGFFGGLGFYYGGPIRRFGNVEIENQNNKIDYGILIGCEFSIHLTESIFLSVGMKFRDPELNVKGKYTSRVTEYNGKEYIIPQEHIETRINMDGITFNTGIGFSF